MIPRLTFERKVVLTLFLAMLVPLLVSAYLVSSLLDESLSIGLNPRVRSQLNATLDVYRELFRTQKQLYQAIGSRIAADPGLAAALAAGNTAAAAQVFGDLARPHPQILRAAAGPGEARAIIWSSGRETGDEAHLLTVEHELPGGPLAVTFVAPEGPFVQMRGVQEAGEIYGHVADIRQRIGRFFATVYLIIFSAVTAAVLYLGIRLTRRFVRPLRDLAAATERVRRGELDFALAPAADDEVGELTSSFNKMLKELREHRGRIIYLEKISSWQEIARRLAHEIKNPLTPINLAMQEIHAKYRGTDPAYQKLLDQSREIVDEEIAALKRMVDAFSSFAKLPAINPEPTEIDPWLIDFLAAHNHFRPDADVAFAGAAAGARVKLDRVMFRRVLDNLVRNAIEAAGSRRTDGSTLLPSAAAGSRRTDGSTPARTAGPNGASAVPLGLSPSAAAGSRRTDGSTLLPSAAAGAGRARVRIATSHGEGFVQLAVVDDGPGIPADVIDKIFNPYFTTKKEGTGLGLPTARKIVLDHGGEMTAESAPGGGARFLIVLPSLI